MKVNWVTATSQNVHHHHHQQVNKVDMNTTSTNKLSDLAPEIDMPSLREAFSPYGEITDVKIMKDPHTLVHKGYGFISFVNKVDAETAIASMNGQWLGTRKIRTNWATRKVQPGGTLGSGGGGQTDMNGSGGGGGALQNIHNMPRHAGQKLDYNEVWNRSSDNNTTVYCGGINVSEDTLRSVFSSYGHIIAIHPFPDRGYAFIRFANKESACSAICGVHGVDINGFIAKCSWGKENMDVAAAQAQATYNALAAVAAINANQQQATQVPGGAGVSSNTAASATNWATLQQNPNWAATAANYQWSTGPYATPAPPQSAAAAQASNATYWQQYNTGFQNAAMMQGWGVMPQATPSNVAAAAAAAASQYQQQLSQNAQAYNSK